jgi:hypothetical protein
MAIVLVSLIGSHRVTLQPAIAEAVAGHLEKSPPD